MKRLIFSTIGMIICAFLIYSSAQTLDAYYKNEKAYEDAKINGLKVGEGYVRFIVRIRFFGTWQSSGNGTVWRRKACKCMDKIIKNKNHPLRKQARALKVVYEPISIGLRAVAAVLLIGSFFTFLIIYDITKTYIQQ